MKIRTLLLLLTLAAIAVFTALNWNAFMTQAGLDAESRAVVLARLDQLDRDLRSALEQSGNTLAAYIGELEDRLERGRAT